MEPNNFEKQFKKQLHSREIKPSEMAWEKLDSMLTVAKVRPKRNRSWIYFAASLLGFLLISTVYFNNSRADKIEKSNPIVLEQKSVENTLKTPEIINKSVLQKINQNKIVKIASNSSNLKKVRNQFKNNNEDILILIPSKAMNAIANSSENNNEQSPTTIKYISAQKLLAEVSNTKVEEKETQNTIEKPRKSIAINPNTLLINAENELNESFRETALDKFNKKLNAVKTVLVNRNFQE